MWKLDRLGRSLRDLTTILDDLKKRGVKFRSLTEAIDTERPTGRAMWQIIGLMAEFERSIISERTRAGVTAAKHRGVKFGRYGESLLMGSEECCAGFSGRFGRAMTHH